MAHCLLVKEEMKKNYIHKSLLSIFTLTVLCIALSCSQGFAIEVQKSERAGAKLQVGFLYMLANFSGPIPSQWARIDYDQQNNEIITLNPSSNEVQIFNREGMELYTFGENGEIPRLRDVASGDDGTIYGLSMNFRDNGIQVFNYRGEPEPSVFLLGFPEEWTNFYADRMEYQDDKFYLLDSKAMQFAVVSSDGTFIEIHDVGEGLWAVVEEKDPEKKKITEVDISGFNIDNTGNIYFTSPLISSAFRLSLDGTMIPFGRSGSGPGKFGVISGIAVDELGNIYVADRLRSVVLIFDQNLIFQGEFGYRGGREEDMLVPDDLVVDQQGDRIFVSQAANKGVGAYRVILTSREKADNAKQLLK
jgi:DNA-binding beta-propeller fold protein YncE